MALSGQDVIDFLNERLKDADCPRCGTNSWSVGGTEGAGDSVVLDSTVAGTRRSVLYNKSAAPPSALPVVFLGCNHCGHVEFHLQEPILAWMANRKKAS